MFQTQHNSDQKWMRRALGLAEGACGYVWPNPAVGCVIIKDDIFVAEAATDPGGRPHAERKALDQAGSAAKGSSLYVTLEPCCHWGQTPPCVDAIIEAGVSRVISTVQDPDPRVNGNGFRELRQAGIEVEVGLCEEEALKLMSGFFHKVSTGLPEVKILNHTDGKVPTGTDALLVSANNSIELRFRSGETMMLQQPTHQLLDWMGKFGLTQVAIEVHDPLCDHLVVQNVTTQPQNAHLALTSSLLVY